MDYKQRPPVTFIAWNIKITKASSMINTKHVLIMHSSYPLVTPRETSRNTMSSQGVSAGNPEMEMKLLKFTPITFPVNRWDWSHLDQVYFTGLDPWEKGKRVHCNSPNKGGRAAVGSNTHLKGKSLAEEWNILHWHPVWQVWKTIGATTSTTLVYERHQPPLTGTCWFTWKCC